MKTFAALVLIFSLGVIPSASGEEQSGHPLPPQDLGDPCLFNGTLQLNASERAGCQIWFYATAGTARFYTYVFQQRLGIDVDWYDVLNTAARGSRFTRWGLINDPACCTPGDPDCPAKSREDTYGFDYCPGDDVLLTYVGKPGYRTVDPACQFKDAPPQPGDRHELGDRQDSCDLEFGTSGGAMGFRKFPNPKFDREAWGKLNNGLATWDGFRTKLRDGSIEPPFLIGMACGACHIAFDPLKPFTPPFSPAYPAVANLSGTVGNQYSRVLPIFVSGMPRESLEWQVFARVRPGTVDTSAIPTDQVNNAGTMNALINLRQRVALTTRKTFQKTFTHDVQKWRQASQCPRTPDGRLSDERTCWCEPGKTSKCWEKSQQKETVPHILKGGEDSIGAQEALQRVYINIGSCAESSWVNHLTDLWQLDPQARGYGQTAMDIGQARRDCPNFRAIEDRLPDLLNYLMTGRPTDLREARENTRRLQDPSIHYTEADLVRDLEQEFGAGAVDRGRLIFAKRCARCHSSLPEQEFEAFDKRDFRARDANGERLDWLGNDLPTPITTLQTNASRAVHSNHIKGHVWEEYASETYRQRDPVPVEGCLEDKSGRQSPLTTQGCKPIPIPADGGRGYYRNVSLLSLWAQAPFLHDNAIGPELCGGPNDQLYYPLYVDSALKPLPDSAVSRCWAFDPSVEGRYQVFKASMDALLHPEKQLRKVTLIYAGPGQGALQKGPLGLELQFPPDTPAAAIGNFRHKEFVNDLQEVLIEVEQAIPNLQQSLRDPQQAQQVGQAIQKAMEDPARFRTLKDKFVARFGQARGEEAAKQVLQTFGQMLLAPKNLLTDAHHLAPLYSNSMDLEETRRDPSGHPLFELFDEDHLTEEDKSALTAFLATL